LDIRISKGTEVPLHEQVAAQLVFLIGTGALKHGASLPSARALARRLGIHRNTINKAYDDLTLNQLAEKRAGKRLVVRASSPGTPPGPEDLDDLVNAAVLGARQRGYSLQQLYERLRERLVAAPPDHLLVISNDAGMRMLLPKELKLRFKCRVEACAPAELLSNREWTIGAVVVSPQGHLPKLRSVLPAGRPAVEIAYSPADEVLNAVRRLQTPSLIAIVSVSQYFLDMARALLAPAVGRRHSMSCHLMSGEKSGRPGAADFVLCDSMTYPVMRPRYRSAAVLVYSLISAACLDEISLVMQGGPSPLGQERRTP
jgi:DNA-binding transcriptional regulator YhcF (GntR family)